jgi:L-asparaginase II
LGLRVLRKELIKQDEEWLFESVKDDCHITEYSIQPTSLEQIFNKFASKQGYDQEAIEIEEQKTEILIDDELLNKFVK